MIETLAAKLLLEEGKAQEAFLSFRQSMDLFPHHRGLIYGYAESLLSLNKADDALKVVMDKLLDFPNDEHLYELQAQAYAQLGKNLLLHQAQGEAYYRAYNLPGAIEQMELAVKSGDGDFYQLSIVEARLKQLRQQLGDPKKK
jgi:beta-barrel assembly-enhancing protease